MDAREYLVPIPPLERWKRDVAARPTPFTDGLCADAPEGARSVRLFVLPLRALRARAGGADAFRLLPRLANTL